MKCSPVEAYADKTPQTITLGWCLTVGLCILLHTYFSRYPQLLYKKELLQGLIRKKASFNLIVGMIW